MKNNFFIISSYPKRKCGIGTFTRDLVTALGKFTAETGSINVAAIDKENSYYTYPVIGKIKQYNSNSWVRFANIMVARAIESGERPIAILQHEYGLDPGKNGEYGLGRNFIEVSKVFANNGITNISYLHTVKSTPTEHQKKILQDLAKTSDGLIVTAEKAIDILSSEIYKIDPTKLKHIDHGTRIFDSGKSDRQKIKEKYGLEKFLVYTTVGMKGPRKGLGQSISAWGKFLNKTCTQKQREKLVYIIAGGYHPNFLADEGGKSYKRYEKNLEKIIKESKLKSKTITKPDELKQAKQNDLIFLDGFLDEEVLIDLYILTNGVIIPYPDLDQISSGILADSVGLGRVSLATKFMHAQELLNPRGNKKKGIIGINDPLARGILVDKGKNTVEQIVKGLEYLTFNNKARLQIERNAKLRGHDMRWENAAWKLLKYIEYLEEDKSERNERDIILMK